MIRSESFVKSARLHIYVSNLVFIPESSATVPIDWSKVLEKSKKFFLDNWDPKLKAEWFKEEDEDGEDSANVEDEDTVIANVDGANEDSTSEDIATGNEDNASNLKEPEPSFPPTISALAECFNGGKFFAYFSPNLCQFLLDINEFGLKCEDLRELGQPVGPRFYMSCGSDVWFLLFSPEEKGGGVSGSSATPVFYNEGRKVIEERQGEVAKKFDKKLVDEVSNRFGTIGVMVSKKLAWWEANTLKKSLEEAQVAAVMMSLPENQSMHVAYMRFLCLFVTRTSLSE